MAKSDDTIERQLAHLLAKYGESEENQRDVDLVRKIASLYEQKDDLQSALQWFNYTAELTGHTDPAVARKASEIELKVMDRSIAEFKSWLEQYGHAENAGEVRRQLEELQKRKAAGMLTEALALSQFSRVHGSN